MDGTKAGTVIGQCMSRHRAQEFRKFLDEVERNVPVELDVHIVMDNASSHKTQAIRNWFAKRPRWHQHLTPTSSSWNNQVGRFFSLLADKQVKRGGHTSVKELIAAIKAFIRHQNANPTPMRWTKSADDIRASIDRYCRRTLEVHAQSG
jgi:transposase